MAIIGAADEFWRLRLTRVDTTDDLDFEWHDDILYREPSPSVAGEVEIWHVEAVQIEDYEALVRIATFGSREEAEAFFDRASDDLRELTKGQFEEAYLTPHGDSEDPTG